MICYRQYFSEKVGPPATLVVMVFFFLSNVSEPPTVLFMGRDKHENEDLIKWGWPEDVWFHVDKVSSAHVYLRLAPGQSLDTVRYLKTRRSILGSVCPMK